MACKAWDEITYPFPNLNCSTQLAHLCAFAVIPQQYQKMQRKQLTTASGGRLNIKTPSYQYRHSRVKDKTVSSTVLSLTWEYMGKTVSILRQGPGGLAWASRLLLLNAKLKHSGWVATRQLDGLHCCWQTWTMTWNYLFTQIVEWIVKHWQLGCFFF